VHPDNSADLKGRGLRFIPAVPLAIWGSHSSGKCGRCGRCKAQEFQNHDQVPKTESEAALETSSR
jgi:hypothetical protein